MGTGKPYVPLGEVMDELARRAPYYVRGPQPISNYARLQGEEDFPSGTAVRKWFLGLSAPSQKHIETFARVFDLDAKERRRLAWANTFRELPAA